jgi:hypothetical protein
MWPRRGQIPIAERAAPPNTSPSRGFVPWRFSDAGRRPCPTASNGRRPKTFTQAASRAAKKKARLRADSRPARLLLLRACRATRQQRKPARLRGRRSRPKRGDPGRVRGSRSPDCPNRPAHLAPVCPSLWARINCTEQTVILVVRAGGEKKRVGAIITINHGWGRHRVVCGVTAETNAP